MPGSGSKTKQEDRASQEARSGALRSWLEQGEMALEKGDALTAIRCAESGLEELGTSYVGPGIEDDTGLKLAAAGDLIEQGRALDGARLMLRMLKARTAMHAAKHSTRTSKG